MPAGGKRIGAGRKAATEELMVRDLSIAAIKNVRGGLQEGLEWCLNSEEPSLIKFVYEHAFGKPTDKIQHSGDDEKPVLFLLDGRFKEEGS